MRPLPNALCVAVIQCRARLSDVLQNYLEECAIEYRRDNIRTTPRRDVLYSPLVRHQDGVLCEAAVPRHTDLLKRLTVLWLSFGRH